MKTLLLLLISCLWLTACTNLEKQYPENTALGIKFDQLPSYPLCSQEELNKGQGHNERCIFLPSDNRSSSDPKVMILPSEKEGLPLSIYALFWHEDYVMGLVPNSISLETINEYFSSKYGDP